MEEEIEKEQIKLYNGEFVDADDERIITLRNGENALEDDEEVIHVYGDYYLIDSGDVAWDDFEQRWDLAGNLIEGYIRKNEKGLFSFDENYVTADDGEIFISEFVAQECGYEYDESKGEYTKNKFKLEPEIVERNVKILEEALDLVFFDKYELIYDKEEFKGLKVIIHFEEITIQNLSQKHIITDLFIQLSFTRKFEIIHQIEGKRTTFSDLEYFFGYRHSHLGSNCSFDFSKFCLGSGVINNCFQDLRIKGNEFNVNDIVNLLINIDQNYIRWESIAGRPYIRISRLKEKTSLNILNNYDLEALFKNFKSKLSLPVKHVKSKDSIDYLTVDRNKLEELLLPLVTEMKIKGYLCYKDGLTGEYFQEKLDTKELNHSGKLLFEFKGNPIYSKIIKSNVSTDTNYYVHPQITNYFITTLNKQLNEFYFKTITSKA